MRRQQVPLGREEQGRVVVFLRRLDVLRYATPEQVAFALDGERGEGVVARRLLFGRGRRLQGFGVGGEVLAAVGGIEAFGEDDEGGSGFGGFEDARAGAGEVGGFVGAWGKLGSEGEEDVERWWKMGGHACCQLHKSEFQRLLEKMCHCRWHFVVSKFSE